MLYRYEKGDVRLTRVYNLPDIFNKLSVITGCTHSGSKLWLAECLKLLSS